MSRDQLAKMTSVVAFMCDTSPATFSILTVHKKNHYRQQDQVCKAGTGITVDVSSEERTSDFPGQ